MIELDGTATISGRKLSWGAADRFTLTGDRCIEGHSYFDTRPLIEALQAKADRGPSSAGARGGLATRAPHQRVDMNSRATSDVEGPRVRLVTSCNLLQSSATLSSCREPE
jgi:hypothetical protein